MTLDALILEEITKIQRRSKELDSEIKAKTIRLSSLSSEVETAQMDVADKIRVAESRHEARVVALEASRAPLEKQIAQLIQTVTTQQTMHTHKAQQFQDDWEQKKLELLSTLHTLEAQIATASARLSQMQQAMEVCKQKVTTL